jgi:hypothetical protein
MSARARVFIRTHTQFDATDWRTYEVQRLAIIVMQQIVQTCYFGRGNELTDKMRKGGTRRRSGWRLLTILDRRLDLQRPTNK